MLKIIYSLSSKSGKMSVKIFLAYKVPINQGFISES